MALLWRSTLRILGNAMSRSVQSVLYAQTFHVEEFARIRSHSAYSRASDESSQEIEKQFTRLEAGVGALKRVQANLKRYRAAVLKAAVEGRLVPTEAELARREGRSYEPASELLAPW